MKGNVLLGTVGLHVMLAVCGVCALPAYAGEECTSGGNNACNEVVWSNPSTANYISAKSGAGTTIGPIDVPVGGGLMSCRYIINTTGNGHFVPFYRPEEWASFINNTPLTLKGCSRRTSISMTPVCALSGSSAAVADVLPYMQEGYSVTAMPTFICAGNKVLERTSFVYTSTAAGDTAPYTPPLAFGANASGWKLTGKTAETGGCGTADGKGFGVAPTSGLCTDNTTLGSGPTSDGSTWSWTCKMTGNKLKIGSATPVETSAVATCTASVSASCGTAAGKATYTSPCGACGDNLCVNGIASLVTDVKDQPFSWTCALGTQTPVPCSAPRNTYGTCGTANGQAVSSFPASNLCFEGDAVNQYTDLNASPAFTWDCKGTTVASCSASLAAKCGAANGVAVASVPTTGLCASGDETSVIGSGPWTWTCTEGTSQDFCTAPLKGNGTCGASNGAVFYSAPNSGLCTAGTATTVTGSGPWSWSCQGSNGGTTASCSANLKSDGNCGSADGVAVTSKPTSGLCSAGTASTVAGSGSWTWSCSGKNGGNTDFCAAPLKVNGACGSSNGAVVATKPTSNLCTTGVASAVSGSGPWSWSCSGQNGGASVNCATASATPKCGTGANVQLTCPTNETAKDISAPQGTLCANGTASSVGFYQTSKSEGAGDRYYYAGQAYYTWTCTSGGSSVTCRTPSCSCAMCGMAHNNTTSGATATAPSIDLCMNGYVSAGPSSTTGNPHASGSMWWRWTCYLKRTDGTTNDHDCYAPRK